MAILRAVRRAKDLTQGRLAQDSGVNQKVISAIETGVNKNPSWGNVARLSRTLEMDPFVLFPVEGLSDRRAADRRTGDDRREVQP